MTYLLVNERIKTIMIKTSVTNDRIIENGRLVFREDRIEVWQDENDLEKNFKWSDTPRDATHIIYNK